MQLCMYRGGGHRGVGRGEVGRRCSRGGGGGVKGGGT